MQDLTAAVRDQLDDCACLLVDGTCWRDDELIRLGLAGKTAREMGHLPIDGPDGSLALLSPLPIERKIYIHINNTNPILLEDAPERRVLEQHGMEVAVDGLELRIEGHGDGDGNRELRGSAPRAIPALPRPASLPPEDERGAA